MLEIKNLKLIIVSIIVILLLGFNFCCAVDLDLTEDLT